MTSRLAVAMRADKRASYLLRARRESLRRDFLEFSVGQRVEQAAILSKEMTGLASRRGSRR